MSAQPILLVRHAQTAWSREQRHTGRSDIPLTAQGRAAAAALRGQLAARAPEVIFSSPLQRARETCELALPGVAMRTDERLLEWDYGAYEGLTMVEIQQRNPGWNLWRDGAPEGESPQQIQSRAESLIAAVSEQGRSVALFAHGHILRVIAACWIGLGTAGGAHLALATASLSLLGYERSTRVIAGWNEQAATGS